MIFYEIAIPECGILGDSLARLVVGVNDAESRLVAFRPLKVIHKSPKEISAHVNSVTFCAHKLAKVCIKELYSVGLVSNDLPHVKTLVLAVLYALYLKRGGSNTPRKILHRIHISQLLSENI